MFLSDKGCFTSVKNLLRKSCFAHDLLIMLAFQQVLQMTDPVQLQLQTSLKSRIKIGTHGKISLREMFHGGTTVVMVTSSRDKSPVVFT